MKTQDLMTSAVTAMVAVSTLSGSAIAGTISTIDPTPNTETLPTNLPASVASKPDSSLAGALSVAVVREP